MNEFGSNKSTFKQTNKHLPTPHKNINNFCKTKQKFYILLFIFHKKYNNENKFFTKNVIMKAQHNI